MAEEIENIDTPDVGDPQNPVPPFLRKQSSPKSGGVVPPFLQKREPQPPAQTKTPTPEFKGNVDFSNTLGMISTPQQPLSEYQQSLQGAAQRMQEESQKIDPAIVSILTREEHQRRANVLQSQVQEKGDIANVNPRLRQAVERILPKPLPVEINPAAIDVMKQQAATDPTVFGEILREHAKLNPERAPQIKADMYLLNSKDRATGKEAKILGNAEKMKTGEYDYNLWHPGGVEKLEGFFPSIVTAHRERNNEINDYEFFQTHGDEDIKKKLNDERAAYDPDEPRHVPGGIGGMIGSGLGGNAEIIAKGGAAATLSTMLGSPEVAPYFGAAMSTPEMTARAFSGSLKANYYQLLDQGVSPDEALKKAKNQATVDAAKAGAQGALMTIAGAKLGLRQSGGYKFTPQFKNIITGVAKETGKFGKEALATGLPNATIASGLEAGSNIIARSQGIKRDLDQNVFEAGGGQLALELGLGASLKLGGKALKVVLNNLARQPQGAVQTSLKDMESHGTITPEEAQTISDNVDNRRLIDAQIPEHIDDENTRLKIADLIQHRAKLDGDLETLNKAYHPAIKQKIADIDEEIQKLSGLSVKEKAEGAAPKPPQTEGDKKLTEIPEEIVSPNTRDNETETKAKAETGVLTPEGAVEKTAPIYNPVTDGKKNGPVIIEPYKARHKEIITIGGDKPPYSMPLSDKGKAAIEEAIRRKKEVEDAGFDFLPHEQPWEHTPTTVPIGNVYIREQGKGLGTLGYILKGEEYLKRGKKIVSSPEGREPEATGVWKKLVRLGLAKETEPGHYEYGGERESISTNKNIENAIQEPSASSILQHPQEGVGVPGSERERMESGQQGEESTQARAEEGKASGEEENVGGVPPINMFDLPFIPGWEDVSGITHEATEMTRKELGLGGEKYQSTRKEDIELNDNADRAIKEGYNIKGLINKMANEEFHPSDLENTILKKYKAYLSAKVRVDPSSETLSEIRQLSKATDIAGTIQGRAFRSRQGLQLDDTSLEGYFNRDMEAAGTENLTPEHKAQIMKEYDDISSTQKRYEDKIAELEAENARLKAEKEIKKAKGAGAKTKKDYGKERKEILDSIRDKLKKARGEATLVPVPYAKELFTIAPDVARLVKNIAAEGITKLEDVVKNVHEQIKEFIPEVTEKDIHNIIAGEYSTKRPYTELQAKLRDLRTQAQLTNRLERLQAGEEPKTQKGKTARNRAIEELREKIKAFKKEESAANKFYPETFTKTELQSFKKRTKRQIAELEGKLKAGDYTKPEKGASLKLDKEAIDLKDKLIALKVEREKRLAQLQYDKSSNAYKAWRNTVEAANIPRTVMASADLSAPLRQSAVATVAHPAIAGKAGVEMLRAAVSQKRFDRWLYELKESPVYQLMKDSGLYIADPNDLHLEAREEAFMSHMAEKIPIAGRIIKGSERAYTSYLNRMRVDVFMNAADAFAHEGKTFENSPELYKALAKFVNATTGRGELPGILKTAAPALSVGFFSPRLIASRLQLLNPVYYVKMPPAIRRMALMDMAKFIATGTAVLALAKYAGHADVETDPRSADFGKIKVGNTRWDIWGGFQQYVRFVAEMIKGETKSSMTGKITPLTQTTKLDDFGNVKTVEPRKTRFDVAVAFARGKLAPVPGTVVDWMAGKDVVGKKFDPVDKAWDLFTPMVASDISDAWKDQGFKALFTVGLPSALGVGVSTYGSLPKKNDLDRP